MVASTSGGNTDYDVTILRIDLDVPAPANCLTIDFRFLSEEFPEYVGGSVNDAFVAELDDSTWTTDNFSEIIAPNNFAFDAEGNVISVNTAGMSAVESVGTDVRRGDAAPVRLHAGDVRGAPALPLDLRPGRPRLRLGGLRRRARAGHDRPGRLRAGGDRRLDGQDRRRPPRGTG